MRRARHRQLLHGDVLLSVGPVRLAEPHAQGAGGLLARPPAPARPALRDRAPSRSFRIAYYAFALRQHPEIGFAAFWWKTVTVGPWPSGPVWFVWVLLAFDLLGEPVVPRSRRTCSIRSTGCRCSASSVRPTSSCSCVAVTAHRLHSGAGLFRSRAAGSSSGRSRFRPAASCSMRPISSSAPASARRISISGVLAPDGRLAKSSWGWAGRGRSFPMACCGALIYIKREILGNPDHPAGLVRVELRLVLRRLQRGHPVRDPGAVSCGSNARAGACSIRMQRGRLRHLSGALLRSCCGCNTGCSTIDLPGDASKAAIVFVPTRRD